MSSRSSDQLDNAVSDVDELDKLLPTIAANPDASVADRLAKLETDFLAAENTFKATPNATNLRRATQSRFRLREVARKYAGEKHRQRACPSTRRGRARRSRSMSSTTSAPQRRAAFSTRRQRDWLRSAFTPAVLPMAPSARRRSARRSTRRPSMRATGVRSRMPTWEMPATTTRPIQQA